MNVGNQCRRGHGRIGRIEEDLVVDDRIADILALRIIVIDRIGVPGSGIIAALYGVAVLTAVNRLQLRAHKATVVARQREAVGIGLVEIDDPLKAVAGQDVEPGRGRHTIQVDDADVFFGKDPSGNGQATLVAGGVLGHGDVPGQNGAGRIGLMNDAVPGFAVKQVGEGGRVPGRKPDLDGPDAFVVRIDHHHSGTITVAAGTAAAGGSAQFLYVVVDDGGAVVEVKIGV